MFSIACKQFIHKHSPLILLFDEAILILTGEPLTYTFWRVTWPKGQRTVGTVQSYAIWRRMSTTEREKTQKKYEKTELPSQSVIKYYSTIRTNSCHKKLTILVYCKPYSLDLLIDNNLLIICCYLILWHICDSINHWKRSDNYLSNQRHIDPSYNGIPKAHRDTCREM